MSSGPATREERPQHESPAPWRRLTLLWKRVWNSLRQSFGNGEEQLQHGSIISACRRLSILWGRVWASMRVRLNNAEEGPQGGSMMTQSSSSTDSISILGAYDPVAEQLQGTSSSVQGVLPHDGPPIMHTEEDEEIIITSIRATDISLGLRRVPTGFYAVVHYSGRQWRTENKCSSVNYDIVDWPGPIPIPSSLSDTVHLGIYASFELQPTLGTGEQLQELTLTVGQLLDHGGRDMAFVFPPMDGDVVSPCSSILVAVERRKGENNHLSMPSTLADLCLASETPDELGEATNQGHSALLHYRKHGERRVLDHSVIEFERALSLCPLDHPCRAVAQSNLAAAKFILYRTKDMDSGSLEVPLGLYRHALDARPVGHVDRPSTLIQLAAVHLARFEKIRDRVEETQVEALLREAIELSSADSHENRAATFMLQILAQHIVDSTKQRGHQPAEQDSTSHVTRENLRNLGVQLLQRSAQSGDPADLEQAIAILKELVRSTPLSDSSHGKELRILGLALLMRFSNLGELSDVEEAILLLKDAVERIPLGHPDRPACLNDLGNAFAARFDSLGEPGDFEDAISRRRDAVAHIPDRHPDKLSYLDGLSNSFITRFRRIGDMGDLEQAISALVAAVDLSPRGDPDKPVRLDLLGCFFLTRFERLGQLNDLEDAISVFKHAVDLTPHSHSDRHTRLNNLGNSFLSRFERLGRLGDLEDGISRQREAVGLLPHDHPDKPTCLSNLGASLKIRFEHLGEPVDLDEATSTLEDAVALTPHGHYDKPARLNNLCSAFRTRFEHLGHLDDLKHAISMQRDAVNLVPPDHSEIPIYLNNLGNFLLSYFLRKGEQDSIEEAISVLGKAVRLTPDGDPAKSTWLNGLGGAFTCRFERFGELNDLQEGISILKDAIFLTPMDHPHMPARLRNLGASLCTRFGHFGDLSDLEDALSILRNAVALTPDGHPDKPNFLDTLGASFIARFEHLGELSDLGDAISTLRLAVDLTPHKHPGKPACLNNLGNSLISRFEHLGDPDDLDEGISRHKDAVGLIPNDHPRKPACLTNLGTSLMARFERLGESCDIEDAISIQRAAADLTPPGHRYEPDCLNNLGASLLIRFEHFGEPGDLDEALSKQRNAVNLTPHGHPSEPGNLNNLARSLIARFERLGHLGDFEQAILIYSRAASIPSGRIGDRFHASQRWISCARRMRHHTLLRAYSVAVALLPQVAWIGLSLTNRYSQLTQGADLVREAAAAALDSGLPQIAVEWLEQGRSIVWGELLQLRSPYDELSSAHPEYARKLRELSVALEHAGAAREKYLSALSENSQSFPQSLQQEADRHRALAISRDKLLQEIRRFPGFERFLRHKPFSQLRASAHAGPVVILNAAESRCDALVVLPNVGHVIHVPFDNFTFERSVGLRAILKGLIRHEREGQSVKSDGVTWEHFLPPLWKCIVKPVLDALAFSVPGELSRIFWCPTGPFAFLPIHAAGFYDKGYSQRGHKVFDYVVSSYVPSLSALIPSPGPTVEPTDNLRLLVVRQPLSDGQLHLPGVAIELEHIKGAIANSPSVSLVRSSSGTVEEVLTLMRDADWVHFACHGVQDGVNSGLCLANRRRLKVRDIIALSRPRGGLAFLSACQTAKGEERLSDEAIHIAAGMLFAGYGGVIGTMWSISDHVAPVVARDVYKYMLRNDTRPDYREAARALHEAIADLRDSGSASFKEWVPFIHVGL